MFTKEYIEFFQELTENNDREWFNANKKRYEQHIKKPFNNYVEGLIDGIQVTDPEILVTPKDTIFRINRDIRFSKDKTPYKDHMSAAISEKGKKGNPAPGLYIRIGVEGVYLGAGAVNLDKEQLTNLRQYIAQHNDEFIQIIENEEFKSNFGEVQGEKNKRLPADLVEAAETQPLLYNKQFLASSALTLQTILEPDFLERSLTYYRLLRPFGLFIKEGTH